MNLTAEIQISKIKSFFLLIKSKLQTTKIMQKFIISDYNQVNYFEFFLVLMIYTQIFIHFYIMFITFPLFILYKFSFFL